MPRLGSDGRQAGGGELKGGSRGASGGGSVMGAGGYASGATKKDKDYGAGTGKSHPGQGRHGMPAPGFDRFGSGSISDMFGRGAIDQKTALALTSVGLTPEQAARLRSQNLDTLDDGIFGLGGYLGIKEMIDADTVLGKTKAPSSDASWNVDFGKIALTAAGLLGASGPVTALAGFAYDQLGNPATVNLGPDVFGGAGPAGPPARAGQGSGGPGWGSTLSPSLPGAPGGGGFQGPGRPGNAPGGGGATPPAPPAPTQPVVGAGALPPGVQYLLPVSGTSGETGFMSQTPFSANLFGRRAGWGELITV